MIRSIARAALVAALLICAQPLAAQQVTITTPAGMVVVGDVVGFDGTYLRLNTDLGLVTINYQPEQCSGAACPQAGDVPVVRLAGDAQMTRRLLPALVEAYARSNGMTVLAETGDDTHFQMVVSGASPVLVFKFHATTTEAGLAALIAVEADLAVAARAVTDDERSQAQAAGIGWLASPRQSQIVALDAWVITHADGVYAMDGEVPVQVPDGAPDFPHLTVVSEDQSGIEPARLQRLNALRGVDPPILRDACGMVQRATDAMLQAGDYRFPAPLFLYGPQRRLHPAVTGFLDWLDQPAAQIVVRRTGFVGLEQRVIPLQEQGQRLANAITFAGDEIPLTELQRLLRVLRDHTRYSLSFRMEPGTTRLDDVSRAGLRRLARQIRDGAYAGRDIMLVGFTDRRGAAAANRDLSSARAEDIKRKLLALLDGALPADVSVQTAAFGEVMPLACDDDPVGQALNRRVEMWVR